ncbi:hypothetical protein GGI08_007321 [Coemansia sp. S2]|nr:hypothetical protein GGI08_007321 [Coemansia sp. S2]
MMLRSLMPIRTWTWTWSVLPNLFVVLYPGLNGIYHASIFGDPRWRRSDYHLGGGQMRSLTVSITRRSTSGPSRRCTNPLAVVEYGRYRNVSATP